MAFYKLVEFLNSSFSYKMLQIILLCNAEVGVFIAYNCMLN